jgi:hypothetical protein
LPSQLITEDGLEGIQISAILPLATSADTIAVDRTSSPSFKLKYSYWEFESISCPALSDSPDSEELFLI